MSITDELREWAHGFNGPWKRNEQMLLAIADRIDAEHERVIASVMNDALYHANDKSMAELGWVRLPKDADGVPIRVGDEVKPFGYEPGTVASVEIRDDGNACVGVLPYGWDVPTVYSAMEVFHYHASAPTVEDVLREFADEVQRCCDTEDTIAEYAARLRLAEEDK